MLKVFRLFSLGIVARYHYDANCEYSKYFVAAFDARLFELGDRVIFDGNVDDYANEKAEKDMLLYMKIHPGVYTCEIVYISSKEE